ncbi:MAG: D-alanine--D-alanine ligase [Spirochaetales bacterium]|nr:D-alanine--D-alanine ligase [Spirochaetales bacterium]
MKTEPVIILYGGRTGEHEVSLASATAVLKNLDLNRWNPRGIGIDHDGTWYLQKDEDLFPRKGNLSVRRDPQAVVSILPGRGMTVQEKVLECACVFPVLHGTYGEDGTVQGLLEIAGLPYAGSDVLGSALGMDKEMTKRLWLQAGLPVVPYLAFQKDDYSQEKAEKAFGFPVFVKPVRMGSSVGVNRADSPEELRKAVEEAFRYDTRILLEPAIDGREIECSVVGNRQPVTYGPGEIIPSHSFYSYEAKYIDPDGAALMIPADLSEEDRRRVRDLAMRAFTTLGASGMSRVDFFYERKTGKILLNEINTIPGFTGISMFPLMCVHHGLSFQDLVTELIDLGIRRFHERQHLTFAYST